MLRFCILFYHDRLRSVFREIFVMQKVYSDPTWWKNTACSISVAYFISCNIYYTTNRNNIVISFHPVTDPLRYVIGINYTLIF